MKIHISSAPEELEAAMTAFEQLQACFPKARVHTKDDDLTGRYHIYLTTRPPQEEKSHSAGQ